MLMTVCYVGKSVNLVTQQFSRVTSTSSQVWERKWLMKFSPENCFILCVTNKTKPIDEPFDATSFTVFS